MERTVFMLARAGTPLDVVQHVVRHFGLEPVSVDSLEGGGPIGQTVLTGLQEAAFVMLVIDNLVLPGSVIFEAGLAKGLGKPVVVLDARTRRRSMSDELAVDIFLDAPRMFARLNDQSALTQELAAYLASESDVRPARDRGPAPPPPPWESEADRRTFAALEHAGARLVSVRQSPRGVPDLSVEFAELGPAFNPVFVEVAGRRADVGRRTVQLSEALQRSSARLGLLVTLDREPGTDKGEDWHRAGLGQAVVTWSLERLEEDPALVVQDLVALRNRLVHGR